MNQSIVNMILVATGIIFVLIEIVMNLNGNEDDTSNVVIHKLIKYDKLIFIPFAIGAIVGHLFSGTYSKSLLQLHFPNYAELLAVGILFVFAFVLNRIGKKLKAISNWLIHFLLITGILYGHFFWSMNNK
jgi:hypothetical protein